MTIYLRILARLIMRGAILPLSQYVFMEWCLVEHVDIFTFTILCSMPTFLCTSLLYEK